MSDAFISYRRDPSAPQARLVQEMLKFYHTIDAYVDTTRTDSTRVQFPDRLMQAIADAPTFILLLGDTTLESEWVRKEIQRAYDLKKHCIPVFQESYKPTANSDPAIDYVLSFDGVYLLDKKNIMIDYSVTDIAKLVVRASEAPIPIVAPSPPEIDILSKPKIILPQPFDWCYIPAGKVMLILDAWDKDVYIKQNMTVDVSEFYMAKYPVTNKQYWEFMNDGGYKTDNFWTPVGIAWRDRNKRTQPAYWGDAKWNGDDYPVVGVTWYEALAFCKWVSQKSGEQIMLPTDVMWQRAAQGDDGRKYPWGNTWDANLCNNNVDKKGVCKTTTVRQYEPQCNSPYGVVDMTGNVWEWCLTTYETGENRDEGTDDDWRVLMGGSWGNELARQFMSGFHNRGDSRGSYNDRGFRLACFYSSNFS